MHQQEPPQEKILSVIKLFSTDRKQEAIDKVNALIKEYPESSLLLNLAGSFYKAIGKLEEALQRFKNAIAIDPELYAAYFNLGLTLQDLGQLNEAVKQYNKSLTIKPERMEVYYQLALIHQEKGQIDDAVKQYEKALVINPNHILTYYNLSDIKQYTVSDDQVAKMESLLSTGNLSQSERIHLCFALAKVYENLGNQDELFKHLHEGNRLCKEKLNYSLDKANNLFSIIKTVFNTLPTFIEQSLSFEPSTIRPIFIVGMPYSGAILVEQTLSSHHTVYCAGEIGAFRELIGPIVKKHLTKGSNIASTSIGDMKLNIADTYSLPEEAFLSIRQQYLKALSRFDVPENVITDKSLLNFRFIGFILSAFPEAKIVHLKRDARATCWSIYKNNFHQKAIYYGNNIDNLAEFYGLYVELMDFWHQLFPDKIYDICYEDLITNQEEETRKLLEYCELDWDENCLNFHKNKRDVKTASSLQVRQEMHQGSSENWKKYESHLQPLIKALSSY